MVVSGAVRVVLVYPSQGRNPGAVLPVLLSIRKGSLLRVDWVRGATFRVEGNHGDTCPDCQQEQKSGVDGFPAFPVDGCWHGQ